MNKAKLALGVVLLVVVVIATMYVVKPKQEQITEEQLAQKEANRSEYLDFIADNLVEGGPPKDGIPSIDDPQYVSAHQAGLQPDDIVFGVDFDGLVAAYPQEIMYWHEVVNEQVDGKNVSITYCPLTGSVIGYVGEFGVSGALYNSNLVLYERGSDTLFPQILGKGVRGPNKGKALETFPVTYTTWAEWERAHPNTVVLSENTGFDRDYSRSPYPGYDDSLRVWFPVAAKSDVFPAKKVVHGVEVDGRAFAVVKEVVADERVLPGTDVRVIRDETGSLRAMRDGRPVKSFDVYWFAWYAYHPDTEMIR